MYEFECGSCSAGVPEEAKFCTNCGESFEDPELWSGEGSKYEASSETVDADPVASSSLGIGKAGRLGSPELDPEVKRLREELAAKQRFVAERLAARREVEEVKKRKAETERQVSALTKKIAEVEEQVAELDGSNRRSLKTTDPDFESRQALRLGFPEDGKSLPARERSGWWLIWQIAYEAELQQSRLTREEADLLRTPITSLSSAAADTEKTIALNNKVVTLARLAMIRGRKEGTPTVKARRGLRIPTRWADHYNRMYDGNLDWNLSGIMQNCMLQNPATGERTLWKLP